MTVMRHRQSIMRQASLAAQGQFLHIRYRTPVRRLANPVPRKSAGDAAIYIDLLTTDEKLDGYAAIIESRYRPRHSGDDHVNEIRPLFSARTLMPEP